MRRGTALLAFFLSGLASAASPGEIDQATKFLNTLKVQQGKCQFAAYSVSLNRRLNSMKREDKAQADHDPSEVVPTQDEIQAEIKPFGDCLSSAKGVAEDAYKSFIGSTTNQSLKDDAKKVFAAWLTYMSSIEVTNDPGPTHGKPLDDLSQTESEMRVDLM